MVRLKAESPSATKAYGSTPCHSLQILQSICMRILDIKGNLFPMETVKHWKRLPREAVQSPSMKVFKTQLDEALGNLL